MPEPRNHGNSLLVECHTKLNEFYVMVEAVA